MHRLRKAGRQNGNSLSRLAMSFLISTVTIFGITATRTASAQTEYWNTKKRAESQRLASTAMNYLKARYVGNSPKKATKNLELAVVLLKKAVATDDTDALPHYLLGLCLNLQGRYDQALDMLRRAWTLDQSEHEVILATAFTQYLNGQYDKVIELGEGHLAEFKNAKGPVHSLLGFAYMHQGNFEASARHFSQAKALSPGSQLPYQGIAILNYLGGDLNQSKQAAEHAQSLGEYPLLSLLLARIAYLEGNDTAAAGYMRTFKKQTGTKHIPRSMMVLGFSEQHDFRLDPFENEIYDSPGALLARQINDEKKEKRRKSYTKQGKVEESLTKARRLTSNNGNDYFAIHETGMLQLSNGDFKGAVSSFQDVLRRCPAVRIDFIYLADAFAHTGEADNAKRSLDYYYKSYPNQQLAAQYKAIATARSATPPPQQAPQNVSDKPLLPGEGPTTENPNQPQPKDSPF